MSRAFAPNLDRVRDERALLGREPRAHLLLRAGRRGEPVDGAQQDVAAQRVGRLQRLHGEVVDRQPARAGQVGEHQHHPRVHQPGLERRGRRGRQLERPVAGQRRPEPGARRLLGHHRRRFERGGRADRRRGAPGPARGRGQRGDRDAAGRRRVGGTGPRPVRDHQQLARPGRLGQVAQALRGDAARRELGAVQRVRPDDRVRVDLAAHPPRQVRRRRRCDVHDREQPDARGQREAGQRQGGRDRAPGLRQARHHRLGQQREHDGQERQHQQQRGRAARAGHHGDGEQQHRRAQRGPQLRMLRPGEPGEHDPRDDHRERGAQAHDRPADAGERPVPGTRGRHRHGRRPGHDGDRQPGRGGQAAAQHPVVHEMRGEGEQRGGRQGRGEGGETRCDGRGRPPPFGHRGQRRRGHQPRRRRRSRGDPRVQGDDRGQHPDQARRERGGHRAGPEGAQDGPEQHDGQEPEGQGGAPGGVDDRHVPGGQERLHDGELPHGEPVRRGQRDVAQLRAPRGERGGGEAGLARGGHEPVTPHRDGEVHGRRGGRDQRRPEERRAGAAVGGHVTTP